MPRQRYKPAITTIGSAAASDPDVLLRLAVRTLRQSDQMLAAERLEGQAAGKPYAEVRRLCLPFVSIDGDGVQVRKRRKVIG